MARVAVSELLGQGRLNPDERLTLVHKGTTYEAVLLEDGSVKVQNGSVFTSLSTAAGAVTGRSTNGWAAWRVPRLGKSMAQVRDSSGD